MRPPLRLFREEWHEIDAVEVCRGVDWMACGRKNRRHHIEVHDGQVIGFASWQPSLPLHEERHPGSTLVGIRLVSAERAILRCRALRGPAVVGDEKDERVLLLAAVSHRGQHPSHGVIHRGEHGREYLPLWIGDGGEPVEVCLRCLERSVLGVEGQVEEPRILLAFLEPGHGPLGVGIGRIEGGVVDFRDVGRLSRVDEIGGVEEGGVGECAVKLIEAAGGRPILGAVAEVPLANADRVVAERLEPAW